MTSVTGLTKERMLAIEAASVVGGSVDGSGHLILTKHDSSTVDAGLVLGPGASLGPSLPASPRVGQIWYDTNNLTGLTDLLAVKNPATSTANWVAYGYGYDTGVTFAIAGGGCTITWANANNHFAGIPIPVTQGEQYLIKARVRVPVGSPDVQLTIGYKTSGQKCTLKGVDATLILAYTADATSLPIGIEAGGALGSCIVKEMSIYQVNQKGYPEYFWDGTSWVQTQHMAQKADIYSRLNTYGNQAASGIKQFVDGFWVGSQSNSFIHAGSNVEPGALPIAQISQDNSAGGFAGLVIRGVVGSSAVGRTAGILFKMSSEGDANESNKAWEIGAYSGAVWANGPDFFIRNSYTGRNSIQITNSTDQVTMNGFVLALGRGGTTADAAVLLLQGADAGAGGGGAEVRFLKNGTAAFSIYTLGSADGNLYVRDQINAKMVAQFTPGTAGNSYLSVTDRLNAGRISVGYDGGSGIGTDNWFRSSGATGWYNASYGTGIYSTAAGWVETYNNSSFKANGTIRSAGEIQGVDGTAKNQFRAVASNYGVIMRNDDADFYILLTASGDAYGTWNTLRPFRINLATGDLYLSNKVLAPGIYGLTSTSAANVLIATNPINVMYRSTASSRRWKNSISDLAGDLNPRKLLDLPVRQFKFNDDYLDSQDQRFDKFVPGFVAEEVYDIYPIASEINTEDGEIEDWNARMIIPPMLALIQELNARVSALETA